VFEVKNNKKQEIKKVKDPMIKTRVKADNSIEVEMKSPTKSKLGKVVIIILVLGMTVFMLVGLIALMLEVL
jgi:hypothetical protein